MVTAVKLPEYENNLPFKVWSYILRIIIFKSTIPLMILFLSGRALRNNKALFYISLTDKIENELHILTK